MITEHPIGTVSKIKDPAQAGRIKVEIAEMDGQEYPEWIDPIFPAGWITMPEVGDMVELVLPEGEDKIEFASEVKYRGKLLNDANKVPAEFRINYPQRRGYKTKSGHLLIFDDKAKTITIKNGTGGITIQFDTLLHLGGAVGTDFVVKGTTFNTEHATLLTALDTYLTVAASAWTALGQAGAATAAGTLKTAIGAFLGAAATWLSAKVKTV